ncbi:MAG: hypothetical protein NZ869_04745 [Thermoanaerobaculum sp.]|nr:hypothetical protein [Thermoanaerobaculum sp.]MDW7968604.1 hypothetical protein [Thermoanaerobaculum sp.]
MSKAAVRLLALLLWLFHGETVWASPRGYVPAEIEQAWFRLTGALDPLNVPMLRDRADELLRVASRLELRRLSPYAQALVIKARTLPAQAQEPLLTEALRLDPHSPEALFALAAVKLRRWQPSGLWITAKATKAWLNDGRLVALRGGVLGLFALALSAILGSAWALAQTLRALPRLWHDLMEWAGLWRLGANAWVFSLFVLTLPLFLALDPLWLGFWLFALTWAYFSPGAKVLGGLLLLFLTLAPSAVELAYRAVTHIPDPITRAAHALAEQRYDPLLLLDLEGVADLFARDHTFFRLKGDVERQFGLYEASLLSYQEGLRQQPGDPALLVAAGTVQYLQGNYGAAVQLFSEARDKGYDPVIVNFNLSLAFAHLYNFRDSDEAIAAARRASATRLRQLTRGRDNQVILPRTSLQEAQQLVARKDPVLLLNRGLLPPPLTRQQTLFTPLTLAPLVALLVALIHYSLRSRSTGFAGACTKCGRTFCSRCKLSRESQSYCTQCVNIFLKRDMVAPELQIAKQRQVQRRQAWHRTWQRIINALLPGFGHALYGRPVLGTAVAAVACALALVALVGLPDFIQPLAAMTDLTPLRWMCAVGWTGLLVAAQGQWVKEK